MKTRWMKVDDSAVLLVFACPDCGLAETFNPCEELVTTGTPVCNRCDCDMDYTHVCIDPHGIGEVCEDNDGQTVIYADRHVADGAN